VRINGNASYAGFGFSKNNIDFHGTYEYHYTMGSTYELTLSYRFRSPEIDTCEKFNIDDNEVERKLKQAQQIKI